VISDTDRLKSFVAMLNSGRYDEARQMISPEIVIHEPDGIPYGGTFVGLEGFDEFRRKFGRTWQSWSDGPIWYSENDGTVVKLNVITAGSRGTGRIYETWLAEFFTFCDGLIVEAKIFYQDVLGFLAAIGDE